MIAQTMILYWTFCPQFNTIITQVLRPTNFKTVCWFPINLVLKQGRTYSSLTQLCFLYPTLSYKMHHQSLFKYLMHKSNVNQRTINSHRFKFQSINKENNCLQKASTSPYPKRKEDIYYSKLLQMYEKYNHIASANSQKIEQLRQAITIYKTISERQALKLQSSEISLAKEQYMTEIMTYKAEINQMQQLIANINEDHQALLQENQTTLQIQAQQQIRQQNKLASLQQEIMGIQRTLQVKRKTQACQQQKIGHNLQELRVLQQKQGRYLGLMVVINQKQRSKHL